MLHILQEVGAERKVSVQTTRAKVTSVHMVGHREGGAPFLDFLHPLDGVIDMGLVPLTGVLCVYERGGGVYPLWRRERKAAIQCTLISPC